MAPAPEGRSGPGHAKRAGCWVRRARSGADGAGMALDFLAGCVGGECWGGGKKSTIKKYGGEGGEKGERKKREKGVRGK